MSDNDLPGFHRAAPVIFQKAPGFNIGVSTPLGFMSSGLMSKLAASLTPTKQAVAETLGAPVDGAGWLLHKMGLPVPGGEAPPEWQPSPFAGKQPWVPGASVPLGSRNIRAILDNPPSIDALLQAMLRSRP